MISRKTRFRENLDSSKNSICAKTRFPGTLYTPKIPTSRKTPNSKNSYPRKLDTSKNSKSRKARIPEKLDTPKNRYSEKLDTRYVELSKMKPSLSMQLRRVVSIFKRSPSLTRHLECSIFGGSSFTGLMMTPTRFLALSLLALSRHAM